MSNQNEKDRLSSVTTTTEQTPQDTGDSMETLTPQEEKLLRMLHGLSEDDSRSLDFGVGASAEAEMKLAMIEQQMIDCMDADGQDSSVQGQRQSPAELLSKWLDAE